MLLGEQIERGFYMKILDFEVRTLVGIHARNALQLSRVASQFQSDIYIRKDERTENAKNVMSVMAMRIKCGDSVSFTIEGDDETKALAALQEFCTGNL